MKNAFAAMSRLATGAVLVVMPLSILTDHAPRCSLIDGPYARVPELTYLLGVALPDTIHAGRGATRPSSHGGHWGRGARRKVYGQLIRVDTLAGAGAHSVQQALGVLGSRTVVIVPWDYDPGCQPTYWSRSARWVEPGAPGFYKLQLRIEDQWVNDIPTFDAFMADREPYPLGPYYRAPYGPGDALDGRRALNAQEMFSFYLAMPTFSERQRRSPIALERLERWAAQNPDAARKHPAEQYLKAVLEP